MDKPAVDWSLREFIEYCHTVEKCEDCPFVIMDDDTNCSSGCRVAKVFNGSSPPDWDLSELYPFTDEERKICRALGAKWLTHQMGARDVWLTKNKPERKVDEKGRIYYVSGEDIGEIAIVNTSLFPSIKERDDFSVMVG